MSLTHSTTTKCTFTHLNEPQRTAIQVYLEEKRPVAYIAAKLGVHRSTIYREIKRGTADQVDTNLKKYRKYFSQTGQAVYEAHRNNCRNPYKLKAAQAFIYKVVTLMKRKKWSIDAAVGYTNKHYTFEKIVSTKTLYNYIDLGLIPVKSIDLPLRVRRRYKPTRCRKRRRILGTSIDGRPDIDHEFGHWEIDTVVGKKTRGEVLLTLDERLTRKRIIARIKGKTASAVNTVLADIIAGYGDLAPYTFKSITADNGSEFAFLEKAFPKLKVYYCHPYAAYERGINEKQNSLIRRFIPKGTRIEQVPAQTIKFVEDFINNLPRKIFNYQTASERFKLELNRCSESCRI